MSKLPFNNFQLLKIVNLVFIHGLDDSDNSAKSLDSCFNCSIFAIKSFFSDSVESWLSRLANTIVYLMYEFYALSDSKLFR